MKYNNKIQKETELTLTSLNGIKRAEVNRFIFNRISASIDEYENEYQPSHKIRFAYIIMLILFVNFISILFFLNGSDNHYFNRETVIENIVSEYNLNNNFNNYFTE